MLSFKLVAKVAFLASLASSSPLALTKRTESVTAEVVLVSSEVTVDIGILNFALTLEHLEHQFYVESLHRFGEQDFRRANIPNPTQAFQNFHHILQHEAQHVKTLQAVITSLGGTPFPPCKYNFGVEDVHGFMALARILEKVGVSAYDGAVALLNNPDLQTAAATIDTVEARHASFIATATGIDPFPETFDVALSGNQIVTLASSVIKECPFDIKSTLGAAPAGSLSLVAPHVVRAGREIKVKFDPGQNRPEDHFCSFMFSDKSVISPLNSDSKCKVPRGCRGDMFVAILNKNEKLNLKNSVAIIAAGPIIVNVDSSIEDSCKEFVHGIDFEWKGYGIEDDKAYDVDVEKAKDDSYKSSDESEVGAYKSSDEPEVDASKDNHSKSDDSKDQYEADKSSDESKVDAAKEDHSESDAPTDHPEVTSESNDSANWQSGNDSASSYRRRGLIWPPSSHAELPLWNETPNPEDVPAAVEIAESYGVQGVYGAESDAEIDSAEVQSGDSNGDENETVLESYDAEDDHMDNGEMENDDMKENDAENDDMAKHDMENDDMGNSELENDDMKNDDTENDGMENSDMMNDDMKNDDTKNDDNNDMEDGDMKSNDAEKDDMEKGNDMKSDDTENDGLHSGDMEQDAMEKGEAMNMDHGSDDNSDAEASGKNILPDAVAVYEPPEGTNAATTPTPSPVTNAPAEIQANEASSSAPTEVQTNEASLPNPTVHTSEASSTDPTEVQTSEASSSAPTEVQPNESSSPDPIEIQSNESSSSAPAEGQTSEASSPAPTQDQTSESSSPTPNDEPVSTDDDDVINALRVEVARAKADQGSDITNALVEDFLESEGDPAGEDDGTAELEAEDLESPLI